MFTTLALLIIGFAFLIKGADWLVSGASALARKLGVSDLAIGLTIVAFGTSMPEFMVNMIASLQGNSDIAIGNVVGSNIFNILLILGLSALIAPIIVQRSTTLKEIPFSFLAVLMLLVMANDVFVDGYARSELSRSDGLAFIGFFVIFLIYTMNLPHAGESVATPEATKGTWTSVALIVLGLTGLVLGGKFTVDSAVAIARVLGLSEALIGLTIVAVGTSLPELATSMVAARKKNADIAVGNIVGSNIFNIFWILGVSAVIRPIPFTPAANFDLWVLVAVTVLLFFLIHNGWLLRRIFLWWKQRAHYVIRWWEGAIMVACYCAYIGYIVWRG
ncbi:MAG TPA: sodium:proton exchanger [Candidatus Peribacter riflensis]|nr:MAG: sodium:proton exchanger [Candidatus Peribacteria bacterium RIFOXYB1_FULL_57_12]OGJ80651.1 MAG: sodium:proton exchanger [Candidatus Peribacteria bacterium RIFOXYC1_FULL_58_8]HBH19528.1 sodium:proton exchanger [Candidatus Peribacter riflensis]HBU09741.1 sodium:proton exchanger [Candidatus Peribacter riflensis]